MKQNHKDNIFSTLLSLNCIEKNKEERERERKKRKFTTKVRTKKVMFSV